MSNSSVQAAKQADKLNELFPILGPYDGATSAPPSSSAAATTGDRSTHNQAWETLWLDASFLPWDRGAPHPALYDALKLRSDILGDAANEPVPENPPVQTAVTATLSNRYRRKALVPGCGKGYDVLLLRAFGYDVTGLEVSKTAIQEAEKVRKSVDEGKGPGEGKIEGVGYGVVDENIGLGEARIIEGDFFTLEGDGEWDLIFDYTFLSALPPSLRPKWASNYTRLLAPSGRLICAEFPTTKPTDSGGPPWGLPEEVYLAHLQHPGVEYSYDEKGKVVFDASKPPSPNGLERIAHWQPVRTHEAGKGTDWISVWRHVQ